ncbi:MAG: hypothetical protein KGQ60_14125 [Planctomycetes bacterium]|nr:hypothetical protein [Planctomycetota bacterium]
MFRFLVVAVLVCAVGCSPSDRPPLGRVTGTVTMDGKPLEGVIINFRPDQGRTSTCETDTKGYYDLIYEYQVNGAKVGPHTVSFVWPTGAEGKKGIPAKYGDKSDIQVEVKKGSNKFDFDIQTASK